MVFPQIAECCVRVSRQSWFRQPASMMWVFVLLCFPTVGHTVHARGRVEETPSTAPRDIKWIQQIVDDFRMQLGVPQKVDVTIVPKNPLFVSVEPTDDQIKSFMLSMEESFLSGLTDDEVKAVVAHELGHVWIFTHHPYLQTEGLANTVALRAVPRESLERVYSKLSERDGTKRDLALFIGP